MVGPVRRAPAVLTAVVLALTLASCSHSSNDKPRTSPSLGAPLPYEAAVLADGPSGLWPLRDADGLNARDEVANLAPTGSVANVVGGTISGTSSPGGARGAVFVRGGRIVTGVTSGIESTAPWSLEMTLRADACTSAWGRVVGTTAQTETGREGLDVLHFPAQFQLSPCRLGVELWHRGAYLAGCHPAGVPALGRWLHLAITYSGRRLTCYENGYQVGTQLLAVAAAYAQPGPLGIGGSGSGFQGPLDGMSISEVAYYDHALSVAQVRAHASLVERALTPSTP